jgi:hypothetical protein
MNYFWLIAVALLIFSFALGFVTALLMFSWYGADSPEEKHE